MLQINQYDTVLLKDGRTACVVEKLSDTLFIADVGDSPKDWDTVEITPAEIERKIS